MTQPKLKQQGLLAALAAAATWGMAGIFIRWLPGWSPFAVLAGRFLVSLVVILPILLFVSNVRDNLIYSLQRSVIWCLSLPAIGGYVLGTAAFQMAPVGEVTLLFTTSPLFVIAYKYLIRRPIQQSEGWGMLMGMSGVSLILLPQFSIEQAVSRQTIVGYLFALGAAGFVALYTTWFNRLTQRNLAPKSIDVVFATCLLGFILSLLCTFWLTQSSLATSINLLDQRAIVVLAGLGILCTALPFFLYTMAAQCLPVILTTAILLLEPMFAVLFASIALQELPSLWFSIGSVLILAGLLLITRAAHTASL